VKYYLDLFTPETWSAFRNYGGTISGFRERQRKTAERIQPGDIFLCYLVRVSRWCGVLRVNSTAFTDSTPIFSEPDPFIVRFRVTSRVLLDLEQSVPILNENVWSKLSFTQGVKRGVAGWAQHVNVRASLREINAADGAFLADLLEKQSTSPTSYPLTPGDLRKIGAKSTVRTVDRSVIVEVPSDDEDEELMFHPKREKSSENLIKFRRP
jgi:hypothetical protein